METTMGTVGRIGMDVSQRRAWAMAEIAAVVLIGGAVLAAAVALGGTDYPRRAIAVVIAETLVIAFAWWSQRRRGLTLADLGLTLGLPDLRAVGSAVGWSLVVAVVTAGLFMASAVAMSLVVGAPQSADVSMYDYLRGDFWAVLGTIAAVWLTSSFAEEVIYRGFLIHRLEEVFAGARHLTVIAVVVAGLIFGAIHYAWGLAGMVQTAVMGIALGAAYVRLGRRLWIVVLAHGYLDTVLFVQIYRMSAG